jgi:hypothetical protein
MQGQLKRWWWWWSVVVVVIMVFSSSVVVNSEGANTHQKAARANRYYLVEVTVEGTQLA